MSSNLPEDPARWLRDLASDMSDTSIPEDAVKLRAIADDLAELRKLAKAMVDASNPTPGNRRPWRFNVGHASDANKALYAYFYPNCPLRES